MLPEGLIMLSNVRLSFPWIIEPQVRVFDKGETKISYSCDLIMTPEHEGYKAFMLQVAKVATGKWSKDGVKVLEMNKQHSNKRCYGSGDEKIGQKTMTVWDGYAGNVYITATRDPKYGAPQLYKSDGKPVDPLNTMEYNQVARTMYGGCRVNCIVKPWAQDHPTGGRAIRSELVAVQFAGHDDVFGEAKPELSGVFAPVQVSENPNVESTAMPSAPFGELPDFLSVG